MNASYPLWLRLTRVFQKIDRASTELARQHGLSLAQFDVLARVGAQEGLNQTDLAQALFVTKANICQLVDRMEQADLVVRRHVGRANCLYLTERGRRVYHQAVPTHEAMVAKSLDALDPGDQRRLLGLLRRLDRSLS